MRLLLVRHAQPAIDWSVSAHEWELSAQGHNQAMALGDRLRHLPIDCVYHSTEPKGVQTASAIADACGVQMRADARFGEHARTSVEQLHPLAFRSAIREVFARPSEIVFGDESAETTVARVAAAIDEIEETCAVVVTHGTAIGLYAQHLGNMEGFALWRRLTLPCVVAFDDDEFVALERVPPRFFLRDGHRRSVERCEQAVANAATDARAIRQLQLAVALQYDGRLVEAIDAFREIEGTIPATHTSFWNQHFGKCLVEAWRRDEALTHLRHAESLRRGADVELHSSSMLALAAAVEPRMSVDDLREILGWFDELGVSAWLDGGWAVDALLGAQTRPHADLDIAITAPESVILREALVDRGWWEIPTDDRTDWNYVMGDLRGRRIDFHVIELDSDGRGIYGPPEDDVCYPASALAGRVDFAGRERKCISAESLVQFHTGYTFDESDVADVLALCAQFDIDVPEEYQPFVEP